MILKNLIYISSTSVAWNINYAPNLIDLIPDFDNASPSVEVRGC